MELKYASNGNLRLLFPNSVETLFDTLGLYLHLKLCQTLSAYSPENTQ